MPDGSTILSASKSFVNPKINKTMHNTTQPMAVIIGSASSPDAIISIKIMIKTGTESPAPPTSAQQQEWGSRGFCSSVCAVDSCGLGSCLGGCTMYLSSPWFCMVFIFPPRPVPRRRPPKKRRVIRPLTMSGFADGRPSPMRTESPAIPLPPSNGGLVS